MTHFLLRQTSIVPGLAATLVFSATLAHAQEARTATHAGVVVQVRLYNVAQVSPRVRDAATTVATDTLSSAVHVSWRDGAGADARPPRELIIRLLRSSKSAPRPMRFALGEAAIDSTGLGVFATVYVDRVEEMAELSKSDTTTLLGRAIAHELGHLLLGTRDQRSRALEQVADARPVFRGKGHARQVAIKVLPGTWRPMLSDSRASTARPRPLPP